MYKKYASLYFIFCIDSNENELAILEVSLNLKYFSIFIYLLRYWIDISVVYVS